MKVQYPGVDDAIRADLENTDLLFGAMGMLFPGLDPKPIVAELPRAAGGGARLRQRGAQPGPVRGLLRGSPHHLGPVGAPVALHAAGADHRPGDRRDVRRGARSGSHAERNLAAETIYRFAFGGIYRVGVFNGDPHPGNYLFHRAAGSPSSTTGSARCSPRTRSRCSSGSSRRWCSSATWSSSHAGRRTSGCSTTRPSSATTTCSTTSPTSTRWCWRTADHDHRRVRVGEHPTVLRPERTARRDPPVRQPAAGVRDHPAHQPRPLRSDGRAGGDRELAPDRRGDLAVGRRAPSTPMGEAIRQWEQGRANPSIAS